MKTNSIILSFVLLAAFTACNNEKKKAENKDTANTAAVTPAETQKVEEPPVAEPDSATAMNNWMSYMTPGDVHKMMKESDGEWIEEMTMWEKPDAPPSMYKMTASNKMILGDRFQQSVHKGDIMGMKFEGISTMGYDNATKKFQSSWVDNTSTGVMYMEGTMDPQTQVITLTGTGIDPTTLKEVSMRETFKIIDKNTQEMEMFCTKNGKETKQMAMKLTRKNKKA